MYREKFRFPDSAPRTMSVFVAGFLKAEQSAEMNKKGVASFSLRFCGNCTDIKSATTRKILLLLRPVNQSLAKRVVNIRMPGQNTHGMPYPAACFKFNSSGKLMRSVLRLLEVLHRCCSWRFDIAICI